jgi:hypothetical protein
MSKVCKASEKGRKDKKGNQQPGSALMKNSVSQEAATGVCADLCSPRCLWPGRILAPFLLLAAAIVFGTPPAVAEGGGFGLQSVEIAATERPTPEQLAKRELGVPDTQAGSHPYALTTTFVLNESEEIREGKFLPAGKGPRDVRVELPPGFVGNPTAVPRCPYNEFTTRRKCPADTVIGVATVGFASSSSGYTSPITHRYTDKVLYNNDPVYNLEPPGGVADEIGFVARGSTPIVINASVRTGGDYGITVSSRVPQSVVVKSARVTIWGVPGDPSHNRARGECLGEDEIYNQEVEEGRPHNYEQSLREEQEDEGFPPDELAPAECPANVPEQPFLTNSTSCGVPRSATLSVDSWEELGVFDSKSIALPPLSGCEKLNFSPTIDVTPDGSRGSTPTGLDVDVHVPQESTTNPVGLGEADMRDTTVTLPEGVQISPSAADGLQACSPAQIGFERVNPVSGEQEYTPEKASCPDASKIATAHIKTPLLDEELMGAVYLAAPQNFLAGPLENPFGSLVAFYLVVEAPAVGVLVKLAGEVQLNPETGQISTTVKDIPQFPVNEADFEFYGTARAPLATPAHCGTYATQTSFVPWSGTEARSPSSSFQISSGPGGSACTNPLPFSPSLTAGTTNIQAGSFSPLTTTITREDGQQDIQTVQLHFPEGLQGILGGVQLCPEAQANAGTCSSESLIGETVVSVGLGNDPFTVTGGKVYLTGPYEGAPFGLSIVNPAKAGPFVLEEGRPVVVRGKLELNPYTTALTFTSNTEAEGHAIPYILDGVPLQIKHVNVTVTRPGFTFNPTSCAKMEITGSVGSDGGASAPVSVPFQVTNCAALGFNPVFTAMTSGKTSRTNGTSLTLKVTRASGPGSGQANFARAKITLPKQLPARLTTLRKACTSAQFEANPAGCPAPSVVGHVKVLTPALPVPLEGPVYFVSHGGEAYPNLVFVLQGYGVTVDVVSDTFISKANVTTGTLNAVPDAPFTSFELTLPAGPYSVFTNDGVLCKSRLVMPTTFLAQNGAELNENTKVAVTGCPKKKGKKKTKLARKNKPTKKTKKTRRK